MKLAKQTFYRIVRRITFLAVCLCLFNPLLLAPLAAFILRLFNRRLQTAVQQQTLELQRREEALQESETRYRRLVETMNEGLVEFDANWTITYVNQKYLQILGLSEEQLIGRNIKESFGQYLDEKAENVADRQMILRKRGRYEPYEVEFIRPDGEKIWLRTSPRPILGPDGSFQGSVAVVADISKRKRMEEALKKSEEKYRGLYNSVKDGIAMVDIDLNP